VQARVGTLPVGTRIVTLLTGRQGTVREQSDYRTEPDTHGETWVRFDTGGEKAIHGRVLVAIREYAH